jgi:hypothetical protein
VRPWLVPSVLSLALGATLAVAPITRAQADSRRPDSSVVGSVLGLATTLSATIPSGTYRTGDPGQPITGTVSGGPRRVEVQSRGRNGTWVPLAETTSGLDGSFAVATPTWWTTDTTLRVYAPATATQAAAATTNTGTISVARTFTPRGGTVARYLLGRTARWNPCAPIAYSVDPAHSYPGALDDVAYAVEEISQATGLRFVRAGTLPGAADLTIRWSSPARVPALRGSNVGVGGSSVLNGTTRVDGHVVLDYTQRMSARNGQELDRLRKGLLLHEIGHAIGLDHNDDERSIMYPSLRPLVPHYSAGDLRGLAMLGAGGGCTA